MPPHNSNRNPHQSGYDQLMGGTARAFAVALSVVAPIPHALAGDNFDYFETHIRPVLAARCYGCHSAKLKSPMGGLLLDSREGLLRGGKSGVPAIVPGKPEDSLLLQAIRRTHKDLQMPPGDPLPPGQVNAFVEWIQMGAPDPRIGPAPAPLPSPYDWDAEKKHWAYQPVRDPQPPPVRDPEWSRTPVDRFIKAKLDEKGLRPVPPASKRALLRRLTYDLTGLPPTPAEIDAFLADPSPRALETVVDRLLASPRYGEQWGRHWLDVVRYADTAGDAADFPVPEMYRYRNYVIRSLQQDKPFDQFLREQIAGDLLVQWLTDPGNPLTPRVIVNRIWLWHFGRGLVNTPNHPELLDYLTSRFLQSGWSFKALHREIVLSRAYAASSAYNEADAARDPKNEFYWRFDGRRLSAEELRDTMLQAAGQLDLAPAGPHPFPPRAGYLFTQHVPFVADLQTYSNNKRSVYMLQQRFRPNPYLDLFDGADANNTTPAHLRLAALAKAAAEGKKGSRDVPFMASPWDFKRCGESGIEVGALFPSIAGVIDHLCVNRSLNGDHNDHFQGIHTGSVTVKRPSIGSWVSYGLGTENRNLPSFVVLAPHLPYAGAQIWSSGFLPGAHSGTRITGRPDPVPDLRRLAERGVRFVELIDTGSSANWDLHSDLPKMANLAKNVDQPPPPWSATSNPAACSTIPSSSGPPSSAAPPGAAPKARAASTTTRSIVPGSPAAASSPASSMAHPTTPAGKPLRPRQTQRPDPLV